LRRSVGSVGAPSLGAPGWPYAIDLPMPAGDRKPRVKREMSTRMTKARVGVGIAALFASVAHGTTAEAQSCLAATDCPSGHGCAGGMCTTAKGSVKAVEETAPPNMRIGLVYAPSIATQQGPSLAEAPINPNAKILPLFEGLTTHTVGAELSVGRRYFRYHLTFGLSAATGTSGVRLEPATFGVAIPIVKREGVRFEIEPTVMALNWNFLSAPARNFGGVPKTAAVFIFSTGADVRANLALGRFFLSASPVGFELMYLTLSNWGNGGGGSAVRYRVRVAAGVEF